MADWSWTLQEEEELRKTVDYISSRMEEWFVDFGKMRPSANVRIGGGFTSEIIFPMDMYREWTREELAVGVWNRIQADAMDAGYNPPLGYSLEGIEPTVTKDEVTFRMEVRVFFFLEP